MKVYLTTQNSNDRITEKENIILTDGGEGDICINSSIVYQTIKGFGGALTESAAVTLSKISKENREIVIKSYFSEEGIGYNSARIHIHSCDFALGNYTYIEEGDSSLDTFSIQHDKELIIPLIKDCAYQAGKPLCLLASPWSPPAFMKTNKEMNHGGSLLPEYAKAWSKYYVKFLKAYIEEGIEIESITVQNEPQAVQTWDSCIYSADEERDFVKNHLGPELEASRLGHIKIYIVDHNRDLLPERPAVIYNDKEASKYVYGTAFHWYVSEAFENLTKLHDMYPEKHLLFTEGCHEGAPSYDENGNFIYKWSIGERYGRNIINDLLNWNEGYLDWNIVLDEIGGPNHVKNYCEAPIIANTKKDELYFGSSYYYIGHFSKFIKPGAVRISTETKNENITACAFKNPDNSIALVILNETGNAESANISIDGQAARFAIPAHSIATLVI